MTQFVYHFKPERLVGSKLVPLNRLKALSPEAAGEHLKKYRGRESVTQQTVPPLDCLWGDVLHLSPINPQTIVDLWRKLGFEVPQKKLEVIRIPASSLDESKTVIFLPYGKSPKRDFFPFRQRSYRELASVCEAQVADWHDQRQNGFPLFWYSSTEHVLTLDEIDIAGCEIFEVKQ
jgi:hypothetical protein